MKSLWQRIGIACFCSITLMILFLGVPARTSAEQLQSDDYQISNFTQGPVSSFGESGDYLGPAAREDIRLVLNTVRAVILTPPPSPTTNTSFSIDIGGTEVTQYLYRVNGGPYLGPFPTSTPITLSNLNLGSYILEVIGGDADDLFQSMSDPTTAFWIIVQEDEPPGGGGPSYGLIPTQSAPTVEVSIDYASCIFDDNITFQSTVEIQGARSSGTSVFVNNTTDGVSAINPDGWTSNRVLAIGNNMFLVYAQSAGSTSPSAQLRITRWMVGDVQGNGRVDDYDLAGLASHWKSDWPYADFNCDNIIDDFDLAGLAAHWTN